MIVGNSANMMLGSEGGKTTPTEMLDHVSDGGNISRETQIVVLSCWTRELKGVKDIIPLILRYLTRIVNVHGDIPAWLIKKVSREYLYLYSHCNKLKDLQERYVVHDRETIFLEPCLNDFGGKHRIQPFVNLIDVELSHCVCESPEFRLRGRDSGLDFQIVIIGTPKSQHEKTLNGYKHIYGVECVMADYCVQSLKKNQLNSEIIELVSARMIKGSFRGKDGFYEKSHIGECTNDYYRPFTNKENQFINCTVHEENVIDEIVTPLRVTVKIVGDKDNQRISFVDSKVESLRMKHDYLYSLGITCCVCDCPPHLTSGFMFQISIADENRRRNAL